MRILSATIKSPSHTKNEDSYVIGPNYIIVADGMGGETSGDVASRIAVETISALLERGMESAVSEDEIIQLSNSAVMKADKEIREYMDLHPESIGMGTTVILAIFKEDRCYITWCGDSRCYSFHNGELSAITKDHSYVQELIDARKITENEAFQHPDSNLITRFVGGGREMCVPESRVIKIEDSDIIVICSDGLSGYCKNEDIRRAIAIDSGGDRLAQSLLELALRQGSDDDITVIAKLPERNASRQWLAALRKWLKS